MARQCERYIVWQHHAERGLVQAEDHVACEEPLEIRVAGRSLSVTMRTPGEDEELAVGFLVGEGVIARREDIEHVRRYEGASGSLVDVLVAAHVKVDFARLTRHVFASSSCGVCGTATIDAIRRHWPPIEGGQTVRAQVLAELSPILHAAQPTFQKTGGLHAAGLFEPDGRLVVAREDIGRHNAVDKVIGSAVLGGALPVSRHILLVSGRASFEIVQKALAAGIAIVAAVSAPSSLAIDLACEANLTLVGFLRPGRFTVYSHSERVLEGGTPTA